MTIKLSAQQYESVHYLLTQALEAYRPSNIAEKLLHEIVDGINEKMRKRMKRRQFDNRAGNTLKLTSVEAKGFYTWYMQIAAYVGDNYTYERIAIDSQFITPIDKEYA